ncbi:MAG TPA: dihydroneopterin aldolase [Candidatus Limnocylindria bacterium]|nr:dihydroneopterin aldolase [Candidatus Limnocylindria bacterium]
MTDRIELRGVRCMGRHGVHLEERMEPQPFEVDVAMEADLSTAAATDDLADTVDYAAVFDAVRSRVETDSYRLIEALASAIAGDVLATQPRVAAVEVRVRKPNAPLPGAFDTVEVTLRRTR